MNAIELAFEPYTKPSKEYWTDWLNEKVDIYSDFKYYTDLRDHVWKIFLNEWNERLQSVIENMTFDNWFDWASDSRFAVADSWYTVKTILTKNWNEHVANMEQES